MKKTEIVEKLLESNHITAKEAIILLEKEVVNIPQQYPSFHPAPLPPSTPNAPKPPHRDIWYTTDTNEYITNTNESSKQILND
jgi:hypothetical protein